MTDYLGMLTGNNVVSPLPNPTPEEAVRALLGNAAKQYIYNPQTKRIFPNSMLYQENLPQIKNGQMSREDMQKVLPLIMGASAPGLQPGRAVPVGGMVDKATALPMPVRQVNSIQQAFR